METNENTSKNIEVQPVSSHDSNPEFICADAEPAIQTMAQQKKESFFSKYKILIGGLTVGVLTITILCAVFIPKLQNISIPNPDAGKKIETNSNKNKLIDNLKLESGSKLPTYTLFFNDGELKETYDIKYYLNEQELTLDDISEIEKNVRYLKGTNKYKIELINENETLTTSLEVVDTQKPAVVLKSINVNFAEEYNPKDFVNQYDDNSREYAFTVNLKDKSQKSFNKSGQHSVMIEVCDISNNCVDKRATIIVGDKSNAFVSTKEKEIIIKTEEMKYGLKKVTYVNVVYNVYKDGTTEELRRGREEVRVEQKGFNGNVKNMMEEMETNFNSYASSRNTILNKTNEYRKEKNISELTLDEKLSKIATLRAMEIAYSGVLSHTRPNKKEWITIVKDYTGKEQETRMAENIAGEFDTDIQVVTEWHNSKSHNSIMLEDNFKKIGIGKYSFNGKTYWVQHFSE